MSLWLFRTKQTPSFQIPGGHSPRCFNSCLWDTLVNPRGCTGVRGSTFFWDGGWDLLSSSLLLPHGSEQLPGKASQHREGLCWPVPRRRVAGAQSCPLPFPLTSQVSCRKQEQGYGAGRMKAAGTTHPTPLPCPRGLPSPWGLLRSSCSAGEQGWGLLAGNHRKGSSEESFLHLPFPARGSHSKPTCAQSSLLLAPAPSPSFLHCPALGQKGSERDKDMKKQDFSLEKPTLACTVLAEKFPWKNGSLGNTSTHFPESGAAFGVTEAVGSKALLPGPPYQGGQNSLEQPQKVTIQSGIGNVALGAASPGCGGTEDTDKAAGCDGNMDLSPVLPHIINLLWNPHPICSFPSPGMGGIQPKGGNTVLVEVMTSKSQPVPRP